MARQTEAQSLLQRTPIAEWLAAALGLFLTAGVIGYTLWEGLTEDGAPPRLLVLAEPAAPSPGGYVAPIVVKNQSRATAAQVTVRAQYQGVGGRLEQSRISLAYVPGGGEARGAFILPADPAKAKVDFSVEGFAEP